MTAANRRSSEHYDSLLRHRDFCPIETQQLTSTFASLASNGARIATAISAPATAIMLGSSSSAYGDLNQHSAPIELCCAQTAVTSLKGNEPCEVLPLGSLHLTATATSTRRRSVTNAISSSQKPTSSKSSPSTRGSRHQSAHARRKSRSLQKQYQQVLKLGDSKLKELASVMECDVDSLKEGLTQANLTKHDHQDLIKALKHLKKRSRSSRPSSDDSHVAHSKRARSSRPSLDDGHVAHSKRSRHRSPRRSRGHRSSRSHRRKQGGIDSSLLFLVMALNQNKTESTSSPKVDVPEESNTEKDGEAKTEVTQDQPTSDGTDPVQDAQPSVISSSELPTTILSPNSGPSLVTDPNMTLQSQQPPGSQPVTKGSISSISSTAVQKRMGTYRDLLDNLNRFLQENKNKLRYSPFILKNLKGTPKILIPDDYSERICREGLEDELERHLRILQYLGLFRNHNFLLAYSESVNDAQKTGRQTVTAENFKDKPTGFHWLAGKVGDAKIFTKNKNNVVQQFFTLPKDFLDSVEHFRTNDELDLRIDELEKLFNGKQFNNRIDFWGSETPQDAKRTQMLRAFLNPASGTTTSFGNLELPVIDLVEKVKFENSWEAPNASLVSTRTTRQAMNAQEKVDAVEEFCSNLREGFTCVSVGCGNAKLLTKKELTKALKEDVSNVRVFFKASPKDGGKSYEVDIPSTASSKGHRDMIKDGFLFFNAAPDPRRRFDETLGIYKDIVTILKDDDVRARALKSKTLLTEKQWVHFDLCGDELEKKMGEFRDEYMLLGDDERQKLYKSVEEIFKKHFKGEFVGNNDALKFIPDDDKPVVYFLGKPITKKDVDQQNLILDSMAENESVLVEFVEKIPSEIHAVITDGIMKELKDALDKVKP